MLIDHHAWICLNHTEAFIAELEKRKLAAIGALVYLASSSSDPKVSQQAGRVAVINETLGLLRAKKEEGERGD